MQQFIYRNQNDGTKGPRLLGQILLGAGILVILVALLFDMETDPLKIAIVGGGAFLIGLIMSSMKSRILIDFDRKKYKEYQTILWYKMGDWMNLPSVNQAEIVQHSFRRTFVPNGITPTMSGQVTIHKVVLLTDGRKFLALDYNNEKHAALALEELKEGLGI
ncbi:hypothetical protein LV84_01514 [Algoriphagus ratkowskyi]|uniref:PH (Pleckstrin Homology) domain-containing protein n=1 Tax=Algoriphagus ratkowskyi TaxID=57028 RepID=A0A2W7RUJ9_9BACT|nr:hypothetical protein [Algoriphagus ratkowskyi]PZX58309.1 hypothetical protein LV84_01514 [Algoriphagus ratkowskyi]TXD77816.1 hypothetical protein ESW18_10650 [Algoriphagus ratkowskyi]